MGVVFHGDDLVFEPQNGKPPRRFRIAGDRNLLIDADSVILEWARDDALHQLMKFDLFGNQQLRMFLQPTSRVEVAGDNRSYTIHGVQRLCAGLVWIVVESTDGEVVVLVPKLAPEPNRNLYRFNKDGTLRWQLAPREYRPNDLILGAEFWPTGNVRARAWENGWSAEIDDRLGTMLRILGTGERFS